MESWVVGMMKCNLWPHDMLKMQLSQHGKWNFQLCGLLWVRRVSLEELSSNWHSNMKDFLHCDVMISIKLASSSSFAFPTLIAIDWVQFVQMSDTLNKPARLCKVREREIEKSKTRYFPTTDYFRDLVEHNKKIIRRSSSSVTWAFAICDGMCRSGWKRPSEK